MLKGKNKKLLDPVLSVLKEKVWKVPWKTHCFQEAGESK